MWYSLRDNLHLGTTTIDDGSLVGSLHQPLPLAASEAGDLRCTLRLDHLDFRMVQPVMQKTILLGLDPPLDLDIAAGQLEPTWTRIGSL